ncbi:hypothetical protein BBEV_3053 [Salisediminibacterium beveridgei]|uniref:DUF3221 domain-containing protein n=2 Tax=Salisediminibacterium beveridgei TaxID=632773 RepID=A0A1D7QZD9_9BACI|nr:hypothetical protein BBEV_3053 [Salisediminibacterium beveridgei]
MIVTALLLSLLAGCGEANQGGNDNVSSADHQKEYGLIGEVIEVSRDEENSRLGSVHVAGEEEDAMYTEGFVTITTDTEFISEGDLTFEDLEEGMRVRVLFDGAVMESHPVQGTARQLEIETAEQE